MNTYIIIDSLGNRHATIKATSRFEALAINFDLKPSELVRCGHLLDSVFAIREDDLNEFKNNINNLK